MPPKPKISPIQAQEKIDIDLRKISRIEGNRTCVDCPEKMPGYVNLTHCTFVCIKCSGIHRELQHKIKGISMSVFTAEDVVNMGAGGNMALNLMYLNRFQPIDYALPTGSDIGKLREFIKRKYVEKKWYTDESSRVSKAVPSSSSSAYCAQIDPRGLQKLGPIPTSIVKVVPSYTGGAGVDLMSMSPVSPTPRCSSTLKGCSDPFTIQPPSVRTTPTSTSNGSNMGHQMRFDAFSSPVIQQQSGYPSAAVDGALRASEQRSEKAALYSSFSNSPPLSAAGPSYPVYTGSSNIPSQGSTVFPCPPPSVQPRVSANPFDHPTSLPFGGGEMKSFNSPGGRFLYGDPAPTQTQYPHPSYPLATPYYQPPGPGPGPSPGLGYGTGPGSAPRQSQGPSPSHLQGMTLTHTLSAPSQQFPPQHQHQLQLQQKSFDQRQYEQNHPVSHGPAGGYPQGPKPPNITTPGISSTVPLSPGPLRAQAPVDPFSSVDALSWGLGAKMNDPCAAHTATPRSVICSPSHAREPSGMSSDVYRPHTQSVQHVSSSQAAVSESTNPFDLY